MTKRNPTRGLPPVEKTPAKAEKAPQSLPKPRPEPETQDESETPWEVLNALPEEGEPLAEPVPVVELAGEGPMACYESDSRGHRIGDLAKFHEGMFFTRDPSIIAALDSLIANHKLPPTELRRLS